jgi:hypothetical protein
MISGGWLESEQTSESYQKSCCNDSRGNRTRVENGWGGIGYRYDPANRIEQAGNRFYTHDADGNLTGERLNTLVGGGIIWIGYDLIEGDGLDLTDEFIQKLF